MLFNYLLRTYRRTSLASRVAKTFLRTSGTGSQSLNGIPRAIFFGRQQAPDEDELDNFHLLPGVDTPDDEWENPPDGPTKVKSDMVPLLHILRTGSFWLDALRSLRGPPFQENGSG